MTIKQLLIETLRKETPVFVKVLEQVPEDKGEHTPHPKNRNARSLAMQLALQGIVLSQIAKEGKIDFTGMYENKAGIKEYPELCRKNFEQAIKDLEAEPDEDFENTEAKMIDGGKEVWKSPKYDMAWTMFLDAVHHRGQLSSYLRPMGGKMPAIYGPSGDEPMGM